MCVRVYWVFIKELMWHFIIGGVKGMFYASSGQKLCFSSYNSIWDGLVSRGDLDESLN